MAAETIFVHITDLHIGRPGFDDPRLHTDTTATLKAILAMIGSMSPRPSFAIASGDLTNLGDAESFRELKRLLAGIDFPMVLALGNHDSRQGFNQGFLERENNLDEAYFHDCILAGTHIITLDSSIPGKVGGALDEAQFAWLEKVVLERPDLPKLVVIHHPPAIGSEATEAPWRSLPDDQSARLAGILKGRNVVGIHSGHIHCDRVSVWHGIPVVVAIGQHDGADVLQKEYVRVVEAASFAVGTIRPSGLTVDFVPLPSARNEVKRYSLEELRRLVDRPALAAE